MKIVYISSSVIPSQTANSIHVMKMCQAFARNGHEVVLIARRTRQDGLNKTVDVFDYYGVEKCFDIVWCWAPPFQTRLIYAWLAFREVVKKGAGLVYSRHYEAAVFCARGGMKTIYECHAPPVWKRRVLDRLLRTNAWEHSFSSIVAITKALAQRLTDDAPEISNLLLVAPDGADPVQKDIPPISLAAGAGGLKVGYVGSLYPGKGMEVIAALAPICKWADFHVVGGSKDDVRHWKTCCSQMANMHFYGHVPHAEVIRYIQAFDVVLLPNQWQTRPHGAKPLSNIASWTSPLKLFEYMSTGKPIVASNLPVLREVLRHEHNALLCPPEDVQEWCLALKQLARDNVLAARIGKNARDDFENAYTWRARADKVLENV